MKSITAAAAARQAGAVICSRSLLLLLLLLHCRHAPVVLLHQPPQPLLLLQHGLIHAMTHHMHLKRLNQLLSWRSITVTTCISAMCQLTALARHAPAAAFAPHTRLVRRLHVLLLLLLM
jgi:hypothetical protein